MKNKQPKSAYKPIPGKQAKAEPELPTDPTPAWRIGRLDFDGPWCPRKMQVDELAMLIARLKNFESIPWTELHKTGSHSIPVDSIVKAAKDRLTELNMDDIDELYSLRMQGQPRLWGIKRGHIFSVLWWDPLHEVCPYHKKHT